MIFVDSADNTFTCAVPPGASWETQDVPFVFWFEPSRLSVKLKYILPVRVLAPVEATTCEFIMDRSETFTILPPEIFKGSGTLENNITANWNDLGDRITSGYLQKRNDGSDSALEWSLGVQVSTYVPGDSEYSQPWIFPLRKNGEEAPSRILYTFYIMCSNTYEETVLKNCKITLKDAVGQILDETVIRIGATFYDEYEELRVNARNHGITLPADICKAFWGTGFSEYNPDRVVCNDKLKELLFNYMGIRGECGNYASARKALEWFGWSNHVELSQLLSLNDTVPTLFLNDYFDVFTDVPAAFKNFRRTTLLSLKTRLKEYAGIAPSVDVHEFGGGSEGTYNDSDEPAYAEPHEDTAVWRDSSVVYDEEYIRQSTLDIFDLRAKASGVSPGVYRKYAVAREWEARYEYAMTELSLKLACLADFYERYLLPVQLNVKTSAVVETVSAAPLKMLSGSCAHYTSSIDFITWCNDRIEFGITSYTIESEYSNPYVVMELLYRVPKSEVWECMSAEVFISAGPDVIYRTSTGLEKRGLASIVDNDVYNVYRVTFTVPVSECLRDPADATHLSVLYRGRWFQSPVKIQWPAFTFDVGTLEYRYAEDEVADGKYVLPTIHEADLVLTNNVVRETDGPVMVFSKYDINIPAAKKNLVYVVDTPELIDHTVSVNAPLVDRHAADTDGYVELPSTPAHPHPAVFPDLVITSGSGSVNPNEHVYRVPCRFSLGSQWVSFDYCIRIEDPVSVKFTSRPYGTGYAFLYATVDRDVTVKCSSTDGLLEYFSEFILTADSASPRLIKIPANEGSALTLSFEMPAVLDLYALEYVSEQMVSNYPADRELYPSTVELTDDEKTLVDVYHRDFTHKVASGTLSLNVWSTAKYVRVWYRGGENSYIRLVRNVNGTPEVYEEYTVRNGDISFVILTVTYPDTVLEIHTDSIYEVTSCDVSGFAGFPRKLFPSEYDLTVGSVNNLSGDFDAYVMENVEYVKTELRADTYRDLEELFSYVCTYPGIGGTTLRAGEPDTANTWWMNGEITWDLVTDLWASGILGETPDNLNGGFMTGPSRVIILDRAKFVRVLKEAGVDHIVPVPQTSRYVYLYNTTVSNTYVQMLTDVGIEDPNRITNQITKCVVATHADIIEVITELRDVCSTTASAYRESLTEKNQFYISIISRQPLYRLFDGPARFVEFGITSLKEEPLKTWKETNRDFRFYLKNAHITCDSSEHPVVPSTVFLWNRHVFTPAPEDIHGFAKNHFYCDDLVCARVLNKYTLAPFYGPLNVSGEATAGRLEFVHNRAEKYQDLLHTQRSFAETNYVLLERTNPNVLYLAPGYYSVDLRYTFDGVTNNTVRAENFLYVSDHVNSALYKDITEPVPTGTK